MKTLENHILLYDHECPLCDAYTSAFIKTGMLDKNGREPFEQMSKGYAHRVDRKRACNEIALVSLQSGEVIYGIDSLFKIISNRFPILNPLFSLSGFRWFASIVYSLISFNRRVIAPSATFESPGSCTPSFNIAYRWIYILLTWFVTSLILTGYVNYLSPLIPDTSLGREFAICGGQILFQGLIVLATNRNKCLHYLGNMMTVSLTGALLLLLVQSIGALGIITSPYFFAGWFIIVVGFMLYEHNRRMRRLELPLLVSITWIIYRIIILALIVWL